MSRNRRGTRRRDKKEVAELDITSLLDILVILLVFLIKSYNASGVLLNIPENLKMPESKSRNANSSGVMVQSSKDKMWVDDKEVYNFKNPTKHSRLYGRSRTLLRPLYNQLVAKRQEITTLQKATQEATKFSGVVNLIVDKGYKYSFIKKVLNTCALAGYSQYKFVVLGASE